MEEQLLCHHLFKGDIKYIMSYLLNCYLYGGCNCIKSGRTVFKRFDKSWGEIEQKVKRGYPPAETISRRQMTGVTAFMSTTFMLIISREASSILHLLAIILHPTGNISTPRLNPPERG